MGGARKVLVFARRRAKAEAAVELNSNFLDGLPWPGVERPAPPVTTDIYLTGCNPVMLRDVTADYIAFVDGTEPTPEMLRMLKHTLKNVLAVVSMYSQKTPGGAPDITDGSLARYFQGTPVLHAPAVAAGPPSFL